MRIVNNSKRGKIFIAKLKDNKTAQFNSEKRGEWLAEKLALESEKQNKRIINYIEDTSYGYSIMYLYSQKLGLKEVFVDTEDVCFIKDIHWCIVEKGTNLYAANGTNHIYLHRLILNIKGHNAVIDHLNHNGLDNRKENLRIVTHKQNKFNNPILSTNTSGVTGVSWSKQKNKWRAYITIDNKQKSLGYYFNKEDAIKARKEAEEKYFGEFRNKE